MVPYEQALCDSNSTCISVQNYAWANVSTPHNHCMVLSLLFNNMMERKTYSLQM